MPHVVGGAGVVSVMMPAGIERDAVTPEQTFELGIADGLMLASVGNRVERKMAEHDFDGIVAGPCELSFCPLALLVGKPSNADSVEREEEGIFECKRVPQG